MRGYPQGEKDSALYTRSSMSKAMISLAVRYTLSSSPLRVGTFPRCKTDLRVLNFNSICQRNR